MTMRLRIQLCLIGVVALGGFMLWLALSLPITQAQWGADHRLLWLTPDEPPQAVTRLYTDHNEWLSRPEWAIEEPDLMGTFTLYNALIAEVGALHSALQETGITVELASGEQIFLTTMQRQFTDLPWLFWLQWSCALIALAICGVVWSVKPSDLALRLFTATGIGYAMSAIAASVYSTRELFIDGTLWRVLSFFNHTGAMIFVVALSGLLWVYPQRLPKYRAMLRLFVLIGGLSVVNNLGQWINNIGIAFHAWILLIFSAGIVGTLWQWLRTRQSPTERAILRWLQLSLVAGTVFFTAFMLVPVAYGETPTTSQGLLLSTFLFLYIGVAFGVLRYRLFALEQWSLYLWSWTLGGLAVIALDLVLIWLLSLTPSASLAVSAAVIGWLYFPARQWVWRRLGLNGAQLKADWMNKALPELLRAEAPAQLEQSLNAALQQVFIPLEMKRGDASLAHKIGTERTKIEASGEWLWVHDARLTQPYGMRLPDRGARLFNQDDVRAVRYILRLFDLVHQAHEARDHGAAGERQRIRRDLHDDLGARLLTLLHATEGETRALVRDTMQDMRALIRAMDPEPHSLRESAEEWEREARQRCHEPAITLIWQTDITEEAMVLSPLMYSHLGRVLREAINNALKHAQTRTLEVNISGQTNRIDVQVVNDGVGDRAAAPTSGRGLTIMRERIEALGGSLTAQRDGDQWRVRVNIQ